MLRQMEVRFRRLADNRITSSGVKFQVSSEEPNNLINQTIGVLNIADKFASGFLKQLSTLARSRPVYLSSFDLLCSSLAVQKPRPGFRQLLTRIQRKLRGMLFHSAILLSSDSSATIENEWQTL